MGSSQPNLDPVPSHPANIRMLAPKVLEEGIKGVEIAADFDQFVRLEHVAIDDPAARRCIGKHPVLAARDARTGTAATSPCRRTRGNLSGATAKIQARAAVTGDFGDGSRSTAAWTTRDSIGWANGSPVPSFLPIRK